MRKIQINIEMNMFDRQEAKRVHVYADADNPYEAVCAAFSEMVQAFQGEGYQLPSFGVKEHHHSIEFKQGRGELRKEP